MHEEGLTEHSVELSATFEVDIFSTVLGPSGLDRSAIEELIERDWAWIAADKHLLQESTWQLLDYVEIRNVP